MWIRHYYDLVDLSKVCGIQMDGGENAIEFYFQGKEAPMIWNFSDMNKCESTYIQLSHMLQPKDFTEVPEV